MPDITELFSTNRAMFESRARQHTLDNATKPTDSAKRSAPDNDSQTGSGSAAADKQGPRAGQDASLRDSSPKGEEDKETARSSDGEGSSDDDDGSEEESDDDGSDDDEITVIQPTKRARTDDID